MQAAATAPTFQPEDGSTPLILRNDTMLGVCTGLGQDFGFNPNYLRVAIASLFLVSFKAAIGIYLALGLALLVGRLLFPSRNPASGVLADAHPAEANDAVPAPDALAA